MLARQVSERIKGVKFMVSKEQFGNYIKEKRLALGLTQEELAEKLFISATAISKWENGKTYPDITVISLLCNTLEISEHEFVTAADDTEFRKQVWEAQKYRSIKRNRKILLNALFVLPVLICFICNLAGTQNLTWSLIAMSGIGIVYSIFVLPFMVKKERAVFSVGGASLGILCTILFSYLFTGHFALLPAIGAFLFFDIFAWGVWVANRFTKYGLPLSFIIVGIFFATSNIILPALGGEFSFAIPYLDLIVGAVLVLGGIVALVLKKRGGNNG